MALVLQGKQASLMHNGGAYGDRTTESGIGVEPGAACATGKHGQFPFASGRTGDSGTNRFAERGGKQVLYVPGPPDRNRAKYAS